VAGIAVAAVKGTVPKAVQIPKNSPVAPPPPIEPCVPKTGKVGTVPVPPSKGIHQVSLPSIKTLPPKVEEIVILPIKAAF
jgi:hypothetical protein